MENDGGAEKVVDREERADGLGGRAAGRGRKVDRWWGGSAERVGEVDWQRASDGGGGRTEYGGKREDGYEAAIVPTYRYVECIYNLVWGVYEVVKCINAVQHRDTGRSYHLYINIERKCYHWYKAFALAKPSGGCMLNNWG